MVRVNDDSASHAGDYSRALRAIGSALEAIRAEAFEITCEAPNYIVRIESQRGNKRKIKDTRESTTLRVLKRIFPGRFSKTGPESIYTPAHIERLESAGLRRRQEGQKPDPHSLPQALRAIGAYLQLKDSRLIQISRHGTPIRVRYETALDGYETEEFTPSSLYALFIRLYVKRNDRRHGGPASAWLGDMGKEHPTQQTERTRSGPAGPMDGRNDETRYEW